MAAGIQSGIGNVAAGSAFAVAQSVGAGGALPFLGIVAGAVSGGLAVAGIGYGIYSLIKGVHDRGREEASKDSVVLCEKCGKPKRKE